MPCRGGCNTPVDPQAVIDHLTRMLCGVCKQLDAQPVTRKGFSLMDAELRLWWEEHQAEDARRQKREAKEAQTAAERRQLKMTALSKLTLAERRALGLIS
jgi:hypothetical protein